MPKMTKPQKLVETKTKALDEHISETKHKAARLLALMNDPHPGLVTWVDAVARNCREIGALAEPDGEASDRALARAYVRAVMEDKPHSPALEPDWAAVRTQARCMLADSALRGKNLLEKLDDLDELLRRHHHYEDAIEDDDES